MRVNKIYKNIKVSTLVEKINLKKNEKLLNVAFVDQNFLKREEEVFISVKNQDFFLLKTKIGAIQKRAVIEVSVNGLRTRDYVLRTSIIDSSKMELSFPNFSFRGGEEVVIVY